MNEQGQLGESVQQLVLRGMRDQADGRRRQVMADFDPTDVVVSGDFDLARIGAEVAEALDAPASFEMTPELRAALPGVVGYSNLVEVHRALLGAARFEPVPTRRPTPQAVEQIVDVHSPDWGLMATAREAFYQKREAIDARA
mgnify:CR=1 FL=1